MHNQKTNNSTVVPTQQKLTDRAVAIWYSDTRKVPHVAKEFEDIMATLKAVYPAAHARLHDEFEQELIMEQIAEEVGMGAYGW